MLIVVFDICPLDDSMTVGVLCDYPSGFDCIIASDVIYEEEQVGVAEQLI